MPRLRRFYDASHLPYITGSTYRRARVFDSDRFKMNFVRTLAALREKLKFKLVGYVLMPEHYHMLVWPCGLADPSKIMSSLKERTAIFILDELQENQEFLWCRKMLTRLKLPPTVHDHATFRVWQRRFFDMNIWSEKKRLEKLDYMHANPVKRGLVKEPGQWRWSSWRFYYLADRSLLTMDYVA